MKKLVFAGLLMFATPALAADPVKLWRDPDCGCCQAYAEYLREEGFEVDVIDDVNFAQRSIKAGMPEEQLGCHHAEVGGYVVSGHVPSNIIRRLLNERPDVTGITLPGMPANSPGMAEDKYGTLKVLSFGGDEGINVYSNE